MATTTTGGIRMRANAKQGYNGKAVLRGDLFTVATQKEADDLVALGFASVLPIRGTEDANNTPRTRQPRRREVLDTPKTASPGRYQRRDLRADD